MQIFKMFVGMGILNFMIAEMGVRDMFEFVLGEFC